MSVHVDLLYETKKIEQLDFMGYAELELFDAFNTCKVQVDL